MISDLVNIKEKYGERMMHLCRILFPTILEKPGTLYEVLTENFYPSKFLEEDLTNNNLIEEFKNYIYYLFFDENEITKDEITKNPFELLNYAGYDLYECKTEEDIQSFKKYYKKEEELCTFRNSRLNSCHVFFAVKKDADKIKREEFKKPLRQDEYGISVISIQFRKGKNNTLSIKNRYNHTVPNPDATFSNNLDNIIEGLTDSFEKYYGFKINTKNNKSFEIPGYVKASDGKYYKYNYEKNNIYYCPDNIIINNFKIDKSFTEKEKYIIVDYFIVDLIKKEVYLYDKDYIKETSFLETFKNIKKIEINKIKETKEKELKFIFNDYYIIIKLDKYNKMISYKSDIFTSLKDNFLNYNIFLENIELNRVYAIGNNFLIRNQKLKHIFIPEVIKIGYNFLKFNNSLETFTAEKLNIIDDSFMPNIKKLKYFSADNLHIICNSFLKNNQGIKSLSLPNLKIVQDNFMIYNCVLEEIYLPNLVKVGNNFLFSNNSLKKIYAPSLRKIGEHCLEKNKKIEDIILPQIDKKCKFILYNKNLKKTLKRIKNTK